MKKGEKNSHIHQSSFFNSVYLFYDLLEVQ